MVRLEEQLAALDLDLRYAFGSDFGRHRDLTTGSLLAIERTLKRREALAYELRNVPGVEQKMIARTVLERVQHRLVGAAFDATGMGWTVAEDMGRIFGLREDPEEGAGLIMAIAPSALWLIFFYRQDRLEPEPKTRVARVFLLALILTDVVGRRLFNDLFDLRAWHCIIVTSKFKPLQKAIILLNK